MNADKLVWEHVNGELFYGTFDAFLAAYGERDGLNAECVYTLMEAKRKHKEWRVIEKPNPGSEKALRLSCCCPVIDNCYGRGFPLDGVVQFWRRSDCPLHGFED